MEVVIKKEKKQKKEEKRKEKVLQWNLEHRKKMQYVEWLKKTKKRKWQSLTDTIYVYLEKYKSVVQKDSPVRWLLEEMVFKEP